MRVSSARNRCFPQCLAGGFGSARFTAAVHQTLAHAVDSHIELDLPECRDGNPARLFRDDDGQAVRFLGDPDAGAMPRP